MQMNQVTVLLLDYDESVAFYKKLGLKHIVDAPPRYARFECLPEDGQGEPSTFSIASDDGSSFKGNYPAVYFETSDVDELVERMRASGYEILSDVEDKSYGWREGTVADPAGNHIKIYWGGKNRRFPEWRLADAD